MDSDRWIDDVVFPIVDGRPYMAPRVATLNLNERISITAEINDQNQYVVTSMSFRGTVADPITAQELRKPLLSKVTSTIAEQNLIPLSTDGQGTTSFRVLIHSDRDLADDELVSVTRPRARRTRMTPELLQRVWSAIERAEAQGLRVQNTVAHEFQVPVTTAKNWIRVARQSHDREYLGKEGPT